ncbi:hypothetical protein MA16_Dca021333 [Dendrobium catenatum]|uniref:Uncharacterized protein n=1 Tax=Dendrobium catenatum TaxID=906689 RepID=A0A2I0WWW7_9ASPA|nr:hypothetical protein MA16_Dca021333 [Dendrobium catenatum]
MNFGWQAGGVPWVVGGFRHGVRRPVGEEVGPDGRWRERDLGAKERGRGGWLAGCVGASWGAGGYGRKKELEEKEDMNQELSQRGLLGTSIEPLLGFTTHSRTHKEIQNKKLKFHINHHPPSKRREKA